MQYMVHINVTALFSTAAPIQKHKAKMKFTVQSYRAAMASAVTC